MTLNNNLSLVQIKSRAFEHLLLLASNTLKWKIILWRTDYTLKEMLLAVPVLRPVRATSEQLLDDVNLRDLLVLFTINHLAEIVIVISNCCCCC